MKCPVCKKECGDADKCPTCGFDQLMVEFLNKEEAEEWENDTVFPFRIRWMNTLCDFEFNEDYTVLIKYKGSDTRVTIPYGVIMIGSESFCLCSKLKSISFPNSVKVINERAFHFCPKLDLELPKSIDAISEGAISRVHSISIDLLNPNYTSINGMLIEIKTGTLIAVSSTSPNNLEIPDCILKIGDFAFCSTPNQHRFNSIVLPYGLLCIGYHAGINKSEKQVVIPNSVKTICDSPFFEKGSNIVLEPGNLRYYQKNDVLIDRDNLSIVSLSNFNCKNLVIPSEIKKLDLGVFSCCDSLESVVIPIGVNEMGFRIFDACSSLKSIYLEFNKQPSAWNPGWLAGCDAKVYWKNEWHYDENGVPSPNIEK